MKNDPSIIFFEELLKHKTVDAGLDFIYKTIDKKCKDGKFSEIDAILTLGCEYPNFSIVVNLALLTITASAKDKLKSRSLYYNFCEKKFIAKQGKEKAAGLLVGLE